MAVKRRHQPRLTTGPRVPQGSGLIPAQWAWVDREARHFNCSRSWVMAVLVENAGGPPATADYRPRARGGHRG